MCAPASGSLSTAIFARPSNTPCGQVEVAVNYLQRFSQEQLLQGHSVAQFLQWREELPAWLFASSPRLIVLQAWALIICARFD